MVEHGVEVGQLLLDFRVRPPPPARSRPLDGIKVLELGQLIAGPFCGTILGYFGADVIKVEPPGKGDPIRNVYGGLHLPGLDPSNPVQMGPGFFVDNRGSETQTDPCPAG